MSRATATRGRTATTRRRRRAAGPRGRASPADRMSGCGSRVAAQRPAFSVTAAKRGPSKLRLEAWPRKPPAICDMKLRLGSSHSEIAPSTSAAVTTGIDRSARAAGRASLPDTTARLTAVQIAVRPSQPTPRSSHDGAVGEDGLGRDEGRGPGREGPSGGRSAPGSGRAPVCRRCRGHRQPMCGADASTLRHVAPPRTGRAATRIDLPRRSSRRSIDQPSSHTSDRPRRGSPPETSSRPGDRRGDVVAGCGAARDHRRVAIGDRVERRAGDP